MINIIKKFCKRLRSTGFFSIFLSSIVSKVLVFIGSTIIVRILSKNDYGIYAYILNCVSVLCLLNDFGASTAALQFLTEDDNISKKGAIISYAVKVTIFSSAFSSILILLSPLYYPFSIVGSKNLTPILFLIPIITTIANLSPIILRSNLENKKYAKYQIFSTFTSYFVLIILSMTFGLVGAIAAQYLYGLFILIYGIYLVLPYLKKYNFKDKLIKKQQCEFLKFSITSQLNNTISGILLIIDTFTIGILIGKADIVASYKIASAIPHALTFFASSLAVYVIPYFIKNNNNIHWLKKNLKLLIIGSTLTHIVICGLVILFSKYIILIIYGNQYLDTIPTFIVLTVGLLFSSGIKVPCSNFLHCLRKIKVNIIINIISAIINIVLNYIFIIRYGYIGAAIATTIINILSSVYYIMYIKYYFRKMNERG